MENEDTIIDSCQNCKALSYSYKIMLLPICDCCAEKNGTNIIPMVVRTCLKCNATVEIDIVKRRIFDLLNKQLMGMEVIDEQ
jgi:hypothetical protein